MKNGRDDEGRVVMKTRITMIYKMDACLRRQVRRPGEQVIMTERCVCMGRGSEARDG